MLAAKELRELTLSKATLILFVALGPLVGHAMITAVDAYAEASGIGGGAAALAQGLSPLDGFVVPLFGAYALASALLFPFVAIRLLSSEKESGAMMLMLQSPATPHAMVLTKFLTLMLAWIVAWIPGVIGLLLWRSYGGHLALPELANVLFGHLLRAGLIAAVSLAAAAFLDGAATAAVAVLAFTLGTWALDFVAQVRGGAAQQLAAFTPDSALRTFEHGELSLAVFGVTLVAIAVLLVVASYWLHPGRSLTWITGRTAAALVVGAALTVAAAQMRGSWDASEDRRNSFSRADERALSRIKEPIEITVHLAPEDPRLSDLQRGVLRKLQRTTPNLHIAYVARSGTGLFEGADPQYGEVWYSVGGRRAMSRSTTVPIVLETIYELARVSPPASANDDSEAYPGHPLRARARLAAPIFYIAWPILTIAIWLGLGRRLRLYP